MLAESALIKWNFRVCLSLGFLFNFLLIWMILVKTRKEMIVHSRILLQTCLVDILLLTILAMSQHAFVYQQNTVIVIFNGFIVEMCEEISPILLFTIYSIWTLFMIFDSHAVTIQFLCRYLTLNRNVPITLCHYILMLASMFAISSAITAYWAWANIKTVNANLPIDAANFVSSMVVEEHQRPIYFAFVLAQDFHQILWTLICIIATVLSYAIIIFCAIRMSHYVNTYAGFSPILKALNRELTRSLIILAIFPLVIFLLGTILILFGFYLHNKNVHLDVPLATQVHLLYNIPIHWLPVLNPLATILANQPYREAMLRIFSRQQNNATKSPVIQLANY